MGLEKEIAPCHSKILLCMHKFQLLIQPKPIIKQPLAKFTYQH